MTRIARLLPALVLSLPLSAASLGAQGGWTQLFDGKTLKGWTVVGGANWEVVDGIVQATKSTGNSYLVTPESYADFQITLDFWVSDDANSGVFIRCEDPKAISQNNAYEVNIFDTRPDQSYRTGAIVDIAKPASVVMTGGKWNSFDITARGPKITVVLNGMTMVDISDTKHARGPIALQYGAGIVKFRNVRIRKL
jgi:hypothetical protein